VFWGRCKPGIATVLFHLQCGAVVDARRVVVLSHRRTLACRCVVVVFCWQRASRSRTCTLVSDGVASGSTGSSIRWPAFVKAEGPGFDRC
jgi:hypothetical protein